jgi:hypothetical protein
MNSQLDEILKWNKIITDSKQLTLSEIIFRRAGEVIGLEHVMQIKDMGRWDKFELEVIQHLYEHIEEKLTKPAAAEEEELK